MRPSIARLAVVLCLVLATDASAGSTITGKLNKRGYTVVALAKDGTAISAKATTGAFKVKAPGGTVTLQLRAPDGRYAGPVVVGKKHGKVVLGIRRGAKLGALVVKPGYATPKRKLAARFVNPKVVATAKGGGPIGSKTFGLVPGSHLRQAPGPVSPTAPGSEGVPGPTSGGGDTDSDGVPNALDVDSNGNGVLDNVDPEAPTPPGFGVFSQMFLTIDQTVNADAAAVTPDQIDAAMKSKLRLVFTSIADNTELDCGGLPYCSAGGTGTRISGPDGPGGTVDPFPTCCDTDGNGFGTISGSTTGPTGAEFHLAPNASSSEIGSGDTMIERVTSDAGTKEIPGALNFVFNTIPALKEWASGTATTPTPVSYPVAANGPGTQSNPLPITKDAGGNYTLTMTFWRPQRRAIGGAGEGSTTVDIGGLSYDVNIPNAGGPAPPSPGSPPVSPQCGPASLSTSDPHLSVSSEGNGQIGRLSDNAPDAPSDPANVITFTVNLTKCLADKGTTIAAGQTFNMDVGANSLSAHSVDHADQVIYIRTQ